MEKTLGCAMITRDQVCGIISVTENSFGNDPIRFAIILHITQESD